MVSRFLFLLSESMRALFRAKLSAIISSITIGITLLIFSIAYFAYVNLLGYSYEFKSKYRIEVFFETSLSNDQARDLFNTILVLDGIEQGDFVDKEKASELFEKYFKENIIDIVGENPLPMGGRYDISMNHRTSSKMNLLVKQIRQIEGVDLASYQYGVVSRVDSIIENILGISMLIGFIIFTIAVILVSNTIRLIIHSKRDAIEIMHLLGATNSFIRFPFILEGVVQGLLGALFSLSILFLLSSLQSYLLEPLLKIPFIYPSYIIFYNILFGLVLALIGSIRGISKYLPN